MIIAGYDVRHYGYSFFQLLLKELVEDSKNRKR